jgi:protein dithiol:quinone oxidoreductase
MLHRAPYAAPTFSPYRFTMLTHYPSPLRQERRLLLLLGLVCAALLAGALYLQYYENEDPCPLCILQRYGFVLIGLLAFVGSGVSNWRLMAVIEGLIVLVALAGAGVAGRHLNIQLNPGFSCGFDTLQPIVDGLPPAHWLPGVFKVAGLCETVYPPIFGLLLPGWSLIGFVVIAVTVVVHLARRRQQYAG